MATYTKRGKGWSAQVRRKGFPSRTKTFPTKGQAVDWAVSEEARLLQGFANGGGAKILVRSIIHRYLEIVTPQKRSKETERYRLLKLSKDPISELTVSELTPRAIAEYRDRRMKIVSPGTVCRELSLLHHMLDLGRREWGLLSQPNPVADVTRPRLRNARTRRLLADEWRLLRVSLDRCRNRLMSSLVLLALETGMRRGELLALRWSSIHRDKSIAIIPQTKTGRPRTVPLSAGAWIVLDSISYETDRVFPISANSVKLAWVRAVKRAGIKDLRFHDLRHEAISRFFEHGLSMPEVALISGHRDARMLFRYTHLDATRVAVKLLDCFQSQH